MLYEYCSRSYLRSFITQLVHWSMPATTFLVPSPKQRSSLGLSRGVLLWNLQEHPTSAFLLRRPVERLASLYELIHARTTTSFARSRCPFRQTEISRRVQPTVSVGGISNQCGSSRCCCKSSTEEARSPTETRLHGTLNASFH